jgi:hypothetical protein
MGTMLLCGLAIAFALTRPIAANESKMALRTIEIGFGAVSIRIPRRAVIDVQPSFEIRWYHIVDLTSRFSAVDIGITTGTAEVVLDVHASPYCLNGLHGTTLLDHGDRNIALRLPPSSGNHYLILGFNEGDMAAWDMVKSVAVFGKVGRCGAIAAPRPTKK